MPRSRRGTRETSIFSPAPVTRPAHSATDDVRPAAPRSWIATTASVSERSMHASRRHFSRNGLPTCTAGRRSELSSSSSSEANAAPWMPSRPVSAPTSAPSKCRRDSGSGPKRSESSSAIGRAPMAMTSRRMPPTPVAAPWYGSMADGWLCDSILKTTAHPLPRLTAPAFSPGPWRTAAPLEGSRRSNGFDVLYEQCSDQRTPSIPSSMSLGGRFSASTMTRYSSLVSATSRSLRSSTFRSSILIASIPASCRQHLRRAVHHGAEQLEPVCAAKLGFGAPLGVRHHAQHVAADVDDPRDVVQRSVRVGGRAHAPFDVAVAEHHLAVLLEARQGGRVSEVAALTVRDEHADDLALVALRRERQIRALDDEVRPLAAVLERRVADEGAGEQA